MSQNIDWATLTRITDFFNWQAGPIITTVTPNTYLYSSDTRLLIRESRNGALFSISGMIGWGGTSGAKTRTRTKIGDSSYYGYNTNQQLSYAPSEVVVFFCPSRTWLYTPGSDPGARLLGNNVQNYIAVDTSGYVWVDVSTTQTTAMGSYERQNITYDGGIMQLANWSDLYS